MSKALVIKGADFVTNALTTITFEDTVDCTGISLNKATSTITSIGGTDTFVATPTPSDTTDRVVWSSSDNLIATVSNGVVTAVGLGTATITATCGSFSATCSVTVRTFMDINVGYRVGYYSDTGNSIKKGGNGLLDWRNVNATSGGLYSTVGVRHLYGLSDVYPYQIPNNCSRLKVSMPASLAVSSMIINYFDTNVGASASSDVPVYIENTSNLEFNTVGNNKESTVNVPEYSGYNINALTVFVRTSSDITEDLLEDITVEFLPAAE